MTPLAALAYKAILKMISEHGLNELPAERILAEQIGVSRSVLRKALDQLTADDHILPAIGRRRRVAQSEYKNMGPKLIGFFTKAAGINNPWFYNTMREALIAAGHQPVYMDLLWEPYELNSMKNLPLRKLPFDGVIAFTHAEPSVIKWLAEYPCPIIMLDHITQSNRIIDMVPDEKQLFRKIARRLAKKGIDTAYYFDFAEEHINPMRWEAFVSVMGNYDIEIAGRMQVGRNGGKKTISHMIQVLKQLEPGTFLFCADNSSTNKLKQAMEQLGVSCPEDFSVVLSVPINPFVNGVQPTCFNIDWEKSIKLAVATLTDMMEGKNMSRKRKLLPMMLFPGETL